MDTDSEDATLEMSTGGCEATCRRSLQRGETTVQEVQALWGAVLVTTTARLTCYTCSGLLKQQKLAGGTGLTKVHIHRHQMPISSKKSQDQVL